MRVDELSELIRHFSGDLPVGVIPDFESGGRQVWVARNVVAIETDDGSVVMALTCASSEAAVECADSLMHLQSEVERLTAENESLKKSLDDCAGRLGEAAEVVMAVRDWDEAGGDMGAETSRLLHNAYVEWHEARERREAGYKADPHKVDPLTKTSTRTGAELREGRTDTGNKQ